LKGGRDPELAGLRVSVVVPVRNEEASLPLLLDSLLQQTLRPHEIVVVDAGSTDGTAAIASRYADRGVHLTRIGPAYPGRGRNVGVAAARHEWIAFIDAGCRADPDWLEALADKVGECPARSCAVFGNYRPELSTEWERAQALAFVAPIERATACRPRFIASSLMPRAACQAAGGFPEELRAAEDHLFFERLEAAGVPSLHAPRASVTWRQPPGPRVAFRRFRLYSAHHVAAGFFRTWHLRVMAMDVVALAVLAAGLVRPSLLLVLLAGALGRLARTVWVRRANIAPEDAFRPDRLLRVAWLLLIGDVAMWAGVIDYLRARWFLGGWTPRP
jgi:glycosyltransferase involved in cell wall biosynthesis